MGASSAAPQCHMMSSLVGEADVIFPASYAGSGVGIEGGNPVVRQSAVHNCKRHGIAIFSELGGGTGRVLKFVRDSRLLHTD